MTDSLENERERILERKKAELLEKHLGETQKSGPNEAPTEPIEVQNGGHLEELLSVHPVVLVDCYADWCGPCQMMEPTIDALAAETDAAIAKLDVDANQGLAAQLGARGVPTFVLFADGEPVDRLVGAQDRATLEGLIERGQ